MIDPSLLVDHPRNPRHHPILQSKALLGVLQDIGIADSVKGRFLADGTFQILDGHLRKTLIQHQQVPAEILDLNDEEALKFIMTHDPITLMAEMIESRVKEISKSVKIDSRITDAMNQVRRAAEETADQVKAVVENIGKAPELAASTPDVYVERANESVLGTGDPDIVAGTSPASPLVAQSADQYDGILALREAVAFPSTNQFGIPDIRSDMLCDLIPKTTWGRQDIEDASSTFFLWSTGTFPSEAQGGVLGFFVDDYRFESVWSDVVQIAQKIKGQKWGGVCTPDFSLWWSLPLAIKIYNVYRSRWVARYWQEYGIKILPTLVGGGDPSSPIMVAGMPHRPPVVGCQCRANIGTTDAEKRETLEIWCATINAQNKAIEPENVFIYGGLTHRDKIEHNLAPGPNYFFLEDWLSVRKRVSPTMSRRKATQP